MGGLTPSATHLRARTSLSFVAILALAACGGAGTADEAPPAVDVTLESETITVKVSSGGDMAYIYGVAITVDADGSATPMKYLALWLKIDGQWKVADDMLNATVHQSGSQATSGQAVRRHS